MLLKSSIFVTTLAFQSCDMTGLYGLGSATGAGVYAGSTTSGSSSTYGNSSSNTYNSYTPYSSTTTYPEVSIGASTGYADVGDYVSFSASASGGTPPYTYYWWLDGDSAWTTGSSSTTRQMTQAGTISMYVAVRDQNGYDSDDYSVQVEVASAYVPAAQVPANTTPTSPVGTFDTSYGMMYFSAAGGNSYTATYSYSGINGTLQGTLNGTTLTGTWYEPNNPNPSKTTGTFYYSFDSDFRSFGGYWDFGPASTNGANGSWNGTRVTSGN